MSGRLESPQEDPQAPTGPGRTPTTLPTHCGQGKACGGWEGECLLKASTLYPRGLWPRGRGKAAGMQESWPGPVPAGWGRKARLPSGPRAPRPSLELSNLHKQQEHTEQPLCVCTCVRLCWGASLPQTPAGNLSGYFIVTVTYRPEDRGVLPADLLSAHCVPGLMHSLALSLISQQHLHYPLEMEKPKL